MSYKDGIPLLTSFEDGPDDDDDFDFNAVIRPRRRWLSKRHCLFGLVLTLAVFLIIGIIVGITVPIVLQSHKSSSGEPVMGNSSLIPSSMGTMVPKTSSVRSVGQPKATSTPVMVPSVSSVGQPKATSTPVMVPSVSSIGQPKAISTPVMVPSVSSVGQPKATSTPVMVPGISSVGQLKATSTPVVVPGISSVVMETSTGQPQPTPTLPVVSSTYTINTSSPVAMPTPTATPTPPTTRCSNSSEVCSSQYDGRNYSVITLNNSLTVLLISDPTSNISSASMDVAAGSFNDPCDYQGLAHFCEHMLFLGTGKFPDEHEYSQYLSTHGGYDNAFTSTQETNYYFDIEADFYEHALDMFSQFFISPLFSEDSVMREIHAVNAEHEKNLQNDNWKMWQLLKHISNPAHPFSKFNTGSLMTLNQSDIHQQVVDYYHDTYSASTMKLVLYDRNPIENLTEYATRYFSSINNTGAMATSYNTTSFPDGYSGKIIHYYPVSNAHTLTILWQVTPSLQTKYRNSVAGFINRYLGYQGNTSLIHYLRLHQLATTVSAVVEVQTDTYTLFAIGLDLTEKGLADVSDVVKMVFQSIKLLQTLTMVDFNTQWNDFIKVEQAVFDFSERQQPRDYTQDTAQTMRVVADSADYLLNPERFMPDFTLVNCTANQLTPDNALVFIGTHLINVTKETADKAQLNSSMSDVPVLVQTSTKPIEWPTLNETEPIYSTPYHIMDISLELMNYWNMKDNDMTFSLPRENLFIPSSDDVMLIDKQDDSAIPVELLSNHSDGVSLWWLLDSEDFPQPRVNFRCVLNSSNAEQSPRWEAFSTLFSSFVLSVLQPELYGATEVGYSFTLDPYPHGLTLSFSGLSDDDVMLKYIAMVTSGLTNSHGELNNGAIFNTTKDSLLTVLKNYNFTNLPYRYTFRYIQQVVMERPYWTNEQILDELEGMEHTDVVDFGLNQILNNATLMCFAHGNVDQQNATSYLQQLTSVIGDRLVSPDDDSAHFGHFWRQRVTLDSGNFSVSVATLNPADQNSVVNVIFQVGDVYNDLRLAVHLSLLAQMIGNECFYELRTQQQLGYVVFCFKQTNNMIGSFQVLVQSQEFDPEHVLNSIDEFLVSYYNEVIQSDDFTSMFESQKDVLKLSLQEREPTLKTRTDRLWSQITNGLLQFDYNSDLLSMLSSESINSTSMDSFYYDNILDSSMYRKLVLVVYGKEKYFEPNVNHVIDYNSIHQNTTLYP